MVEQAAEYIERQKKSRVAGVERSMVPPQPNAQEIVSFSFNVLVNHPIHFDSAERALVWCGTPT